MSSNEKNNLSNSDDKQKGNRIKREVNKSIPVKNVAETNQERGKKFAQEVKSAAPKQINWQSYPYNSSSEKKLQERAGKVVEKILSCSTSNELIELKISEREITWLKENVLTTAQREQVREIELTRQGNLFSIDANQQVVHYEFNDVMKSIDEEMSRLNWSRGDGKDYLLKTYGVKSRRKLSDGQLVEFWKYLEKQ